jgi:hypothetical protein
VLKNDVTKVVSLQGLYVAQSTNCVVKSWFIAPLAAYNPTHLCILFFKLPLSIPENYQPNFNSIAAGPDVKSHSIKSPPGLPDVGLHHCPFCFLKKLSCPPPVTTLVVSIPPGPGKAHRQVSASRIGTYEITLIQIAETVPKFWCPALPSQG